MADRTRQRTKLVVVKKWQYGDRFSEFWVNVIDFIALCPEFAQQFMYAGCAVGILDTSAPSTLWTEKQVMVWSAWAHGLDGWVTDPPPVFVVSSEALAKRAGKRPEVIRELIEEWEREHPFSSQDPPA